MTKYEAFQDPSEPLVIDPFMMDGDVMALAIRPVTRISAEAIADSMLRVRRDILNEYGAPASVLANYDPATESKKQRGYIADASPKTYYFGASLGVPEYINVFSERDKYGLPVDTSDIEETLDTVGLAKVSSNESGVVLEALDVSPDYKGRSIGSLLMLKALRVYGRHAGVVDDGRAVSAPDLMLSIAPQERNLQLPGMLEALGMTSNAQNTYIAPLRDVHARLTERLRARSFDV